MAQPTAHPYCLDLGRQRADLRPVLLIDRGDQYGQQLAQSIHRQVHLGTLAPLVPIVASTLATLWARLKHPAIQNRRARLRRLPFNLAHQHTQVARRVLPLWSIFRHQGQVGRNERPFVVRYVAQIRFSCHALSIPYPDLKVHNRL